MKGEFPEMASEVIRPRRRRISVGWLLAAVALLGLMFVFASIFGLMSLAALGRPEALGEKVAVIRVDGLIVAGSSYGMFSTAVASSERIGDFIQRAGKDKTVKAIVLRLNSPGGSPAGAQEIYQELMRARKKWGKPIIASMGDVAASGGYYVACGADRIVANASTITGSIGVIYSQSDLSELFRKIGYRQEVLKSGKFKDLGSYSRPLAPEERRIVRDLIEDTFEQFVKAVAQGRGLSERRVRSLADGRVFTGRQALKLKLVDALGNMRTAIEIAARRAGIEGEPVVVEYGRPSLLELLSAGYGSERSPFSRLLYSHIAGKLSPIAW
jgi:protease-4